MDQSRRAVESYWRSRIIDGATSNEDKVTPVYKLEEICDLLTSSHASIVKELSEFILKRLEHKSPLVKQKALRVIKYAVGKSGAEFRREMQRNSIAIRQLIHYKGQPDPLKGDALNKAVRETAQEALSALFSSDESKPAPTETSLGSRIQGFGSTNYEIPSEDKRSFISEVVEIGSATIKQRLSSLTQSPSLRKNNDTGSYKSPNLRRSLTIESDYSDRYEGIGSHAETQNSSRFSNNAGSGNWGHDINASLEGTSNGESGSTYGNKTREEKLLETIVTSGGVRLQPTRDALHVFLLEALKLNSLSLARAIETKMKSPMWQVRMKAICVLEAVLRKKDEEQFSVVASYFSENSDVVLQCSESPQASLRDKGNKVLSLLGVGQNGVVSRIEKSEKTPQHSMMPDLIDTGGPADLLAEGDLKGTETEPRNINVATSTAPLIDNLFGDSFGGGESINGQKLDDDPFADVSFHTSQDKATDLFSGIAVNKPGVMEVNVASHKAEPESFDFFNSSSEVSQGHGNTKNNVNDLMDGLSFNGNDPLMKQNGSTVKKFSGNVDPVSRINPDHKISDDILNSGFASLATGMNASPVHPLGAMAYNFPSGLMFNPSFSSQPMNYGSMGGLFAQQQFLATMTNLQQPGNLQPSTSTNLAAPTGGNSSPLPHIFNPGMATQPSTSLMNNSKRENTKAFDFISDHMTAARDPNR